MEVNHYYIARANGNNNVAEPPELIELDLMEEFHWTPMEIDQIPLGRLQGIMIARNQREISRLTAAEIVANRNGTANNKQSAPPSSNRKRKK